MRMRSMPRGLMVIGIVLAAAAAVQAFDDTAKPANNCTVCASMASCPGMMDGAVKCESYNIQNGVAMLFTVSDPAKSAEFHQGWDQCKAEMDKAVKMSKSEAQTHLCEMCQGYYNLTHQGAQWDYVKTENGVLCLLTGKKAKLVTAIQNQAAVCREMMSKKAAACSDTQAPATVTAEKEGEADPPEKEADPNSP
jgi:hypothetical protein